MAARLAMPIPEVIKIIIHLEAAAEAAIASIAMASKSPKMSTILQSLAQEEKEATAQRLQLLEVKTVAMEAHPLSWVLRPKEEKVEPLQLVEAVSETEMAELEGALSGPEQLELTDQPLDIVLLQKPQNSAEAVAAVMPDMLAAAFLAEMEALILAERAADTMRIRLVSPQEQVAEVVVEVPILMEHQALQAVQAV